MVKMRIWVLSAQNMVCNEKERTQVHLNHLHLACISANLFGISIKMISRIRFTQSIPLHFIWVFDVCNIYDSNSDRFITKCSLPIHLPFSISDRNEKENERETDNDFINRMKWNNSSAVSAKWQKMNQEFHSPYADSNIHTKQC